MSAGGPFPCWREPGLAPPTNTLPPPAHRDLDALKFLPDSGDDKGDGFEQADKLHPFEVSALINLNPTDVNEMLELVPSLDRLNAEDQNKVFTVLREGIDS